MRLSLTRGGDAVVVTTDGAHATLSSSASSPPGSTVEGRAPSLEAVFALKVRGCKRQEDGRFAIQGRWVNLSREQRQLLLAAFSSPCD
ncbi:MAG: hypothetical protein KIT72_03905 [Polyangiaceae bacterium]|nr:hypothetical protein [Polyangiaceae bacterium]MCW5789547.1 hypothetical protein [Polyangiaceae bacterium]